MSALAVATALAGCSVGPDYHTPSLYMPASFLASSDQKPQPRGPEPADLTQWWRSLRDPELDALEDRALQENFDLEAALDRLQSARAALTVIAGGALPEGGLDAGAGYGTGANETNSVVSGPLRAAENRPGFRSLQAAGGFEATWDLDLFGRIRRELEAQVYDVEALKAARDWVAVAVTSDVARAYMDMRGLQAQMAVLEKSIEVAKSGANLQQTRFDRGLTNELDVALSKREVATLQAALSPFVAQIAARQHAIATLLGQYPEALAKELAKPAPFPALPQRVPIGAPVDLLRRRPDIAEAERRVAAATARVGVAIAALFPDVGVNGAGGAQGGSIAASSATKTMTWIGSVASGVYWPLLDFGALDAQIEIADYATRERLVLYKQTIVTAVQQVDDATASLRAQQERLGSLNRAVSAALLSTRLASDRYDRGLTDYLNVLDAERQQFALQQDYALAQQVEGESLAGLYKALGGGWQPGAAIPPIRTPQPAAIAVTRYLPGKPEGAH